MSHKQIEAFRAVMTSTTMTEASRRLHTSQPSISRLISDLERKVGMALFDRKKGRVTPTAEGLRFFAEVERSFVSLDHIMQFASQIRDLHQGQITIAAMPALCLDLLPLTVKSFLQDFPDMYVALHARSSLQIVSWISSQQIELGLSTPPFDVTGVRPTMIVETPCICVLPVGHPLADREVIGIDDIKNEPMVLISNSSVRADIEDLFNQAGARLRPVLESPLSIVVARHVELGLGIAIMEPYTASYLRNRPLVFRPLKSQVNFRYGVLVSDQNKPSKALMLFQEKLEEQLLLQNIPGGGKQKIHRIVE